MSRCLFFEVYRFILYAFTEALSRLNVVIRQPDALLSDNVMAYDNAVSALGKICQFHRDSIDTSQVAPFSLWCTSTCLDMLIYIMLI